MSGRVVSPAIALRTCYDAAIAAVQPVRAMRKHLDSLVPDPGECWIIAAGKAAPGMAQAITAWLAAHDRAPAGGIIVAADRFVAPDAAIAATTGDHPIPGANSLRAADAVGNLIGQIPADAAVHVAISGGASSLIAGPLAGLTGADVTATFAALISSGLDIHGMNAVRKRVTRWSAGRLALALAPRRLRVWLISDVPGDDPADIASGPCTADSWHGDAVRSLLDRRGLLDSLPAPVRDALSIETPKPGREFFSTFRPVIVANNRAALDAAADAARALGVDARIMDDPLEGEAATMGRRIASGMRATAGGPTITLWGGETVVTIAENSGVGGRSQELALAASESLRGVLLAAGTDGRDGPTDAAGAIVDEQSWGQIRAAGRDPDRDLVHHDSHAALDAAGALLRTGPTGTNVMDIALAATGWG